jgi:hypothetical protein
MCIVSWKLQISRAGTQATTYTQHLTEFLRAVRQQDPATSLISRLAMAVALILRQFPVNNLSLCGCSIIKRK